MIKLSSQVVLANAVNPLVELLERRRFLTVTTTLSPSANEVESANIVTIAGEKVHAVPHEWVITLSTEKSEDLQPKRVGSTSAPEYSDAAISVAPLANAFGLEATLIESARYLGATDTIKIVADPALSADDALAMLRKFDGVLHVEPNRIGSLAATTNDPQSNTAGQQKDWVQRINAFNAWNTTKGSSSVVVAVLDNGVYSSHEDLVD